MTAVASLLGAFAGSIALSLGISYLAIRLFLGVLQGNVNGSI